MNLGDMTWREVEQYLKKRKDIILPFGSVEEHGFHLPLSTDGDITIAVSDELSLRKGVAVAPIIWYGICNTTRSYPGTLSADFDSFKSFTADLLKNLAESGFQKIYIISGHLGGSHVSALKEASRGKDLEAIFLDLRKVDSKDILDTQPFHAGEGETSLMLYIHPDKVDMSQAVDEEIVFDEFSMTKSVKITKSGVWGSATKATSKKGELFFNRIVDTFDKSFL
jgi:creatinine amidohydrolase